MAKVHRFYRLFRELKEEDRTQTRDRFIFDLVYGRSSEEFDRIKSLDGKASRIVAISGIVLSLETGFISVLLSNIPKGSDFYITSRLLLVTSFIFLIASITFSLRAYAIKTWKTAPNVEHLLNEYAMQDRSLDEIQIQVTKELVEAVKENKHVNEKKAEDIKNGLYTLALGIFAYFLFVIGLLIV